MSLNSMVERCSGKWINGFAVCISGNDLYFSVLVAQNKIEEDMWEKIWLLKALIYAEHGMP